MMCPKKRSCSLVVLLVQVLGLRLLLPGVAAFHVVVTTTKHSTTSNTFTSVPIVRPRRRRRRNTIISNLYSSSKDESEEKDDDSPLNGGKQFNGGFDPFAAATGGGARLPKKPNKLDLYSEEELLNVLNIHNQLKDEGREQQDDVVKEEEQMDDASSGFGISPSLHEMVLETLQQMEDDDEDEEEEDSKTNDPATPPVLDERLRSKLKLIRAIASDVDGTLVSVKHDVHPTTQAAVIEAVKAAYGPRRSSNKNKDDDDEKDNSINNNLQLFFLATGKSRAGALESLGADLNHVLTSQYSVPGVFIQGLYCVDDKGEVIFEKRLTPEAIDAAAQFVLDNNSLSMFGYNGDTILTTKEADPKHVRDYHNVWGEPAPVTIDSFAEYEAGFHKILFMSDDVEPLSQQLRPKLDAVAVENNCATTQAVPTMIELLPAGCSKALGVQKLCQHYGIDPTSQLLAIGDAENDIGMLEMASIGVAVGNAAPHVKEVADIVLEETNNQGGAGIAIEMYGLGKAREQ